MYRLPHRLHERSVHLRYRLLYARPDHVWLASWPRSGNTWLRQMLHDVLYTGRGSALPMRETIPDLHQGLAGVARMPGRMIKTHYPRHRAYRRIVYLLRHPAGCLPSHFRYVRARWPDRAPSLEAFVRWQLAGQGPYGSWQDHVRSYCASGLDADRLLVVRYEDMLLDPAAWLGRILEFAGETADERAVRAVAEAHMDRMLAGSLEGDYAGKARALYDRQTRKGPEALPPAVLARILDSEAGALARELGYDDAAAPAEMNRAA